MAKIEIINRISVSFEVISAHYMGIRTLTEAADRAIALGIRDYLQYQSCLKDTVQMVDRIMVPWIEE